MPNQNRHRSKRAFFKAGWTHFWTQTFKLFIDPVFVTLTIIGNSFVLINAFVFYSYEHAVNNQVNGVLDAVYWAVATVTTVGYGDITPVTSLGKVHGILLMLAGTAIFLSFTALFAKAILGKDIEDVEREVRKLEDQVKKMSQE